MTLSAANVSAAVIYGDRGVFESQLGALITDDYSAAGYLAGDSLDLATFDIHTDGNISAVLGETDYTSTGFDDNNLIVNQRDGDPAYCAGCNGSYELGFTTTSIGNADGVFGVGLDLLGTTEGVFGTTAFVTFGDGSTANYGLPDRVDTFWGITSDLLISSIHFGLLDGAVNTDNSVQRMGHDNLTIGAKASVPAPATVVLLGLALIGLAYRRQR
ncbi:PEP-CTERM sorting domain-containing protein [Corallincola platygyrae]|uniref:PEP-CTERM sorting domain-containing protein n=1 Tax=Corallincola platygyrae TaxID=1193278 RepID=A0ABW4XMF2_9GAMM